MLEIPTFCVFTLTIILGRDLWKIGSLGIFLGGTNRDIGGLYFLITSFDIKGLGGLLLVGNTGELNFRCVSRAVL